MIVFGDKSQIANPSRPPSGIAPGQLILQIGPRIASIFGDEKPRLAAEINPPVAAMRGVRVDLVIPEKSNHTLVDWATRANIGPLLADGARIWRSPSPFHHSKMMVVDEEWCLIGSCNWDIRSFRLNFELCMEVYDRDLATTLLALMTSARGSALTQADLDARSLPVRIRDAGARLMLPYL